MQALELFRVAAKLVVDKGDFDKDMQEADKGGKSFAENLSGYMEKAKNVITGIMGALAIKEVVSGIWNLAKETAAAGDRIDKTSQALGFSRKAFQEWDYILAQNGASIDSLGASMRTLQAAISANSGETAAALSQLGLSAAHLQSISPEEQFEEIVRALQKLPDGAKKSQLAMQLLGRNAQSLMPLLNSSAEATEELRQRAHDLGLVMSDDDVDASVAFGDALDDLNKTWTGIKQKFGVQVLPFLTKGLQTAADALGKISNAVRNAFKTGDWSGVFKTVVDQLKSILRLDQIKWPTWDDVRAAATIAWETIKKGLTSVFKFVFGETADGGIKWPTWDDVKAAAIKAWDVIKAGAKEVFKFIFGETEDGGIKWPTSTEIWNKIKGGLKALWNDIRTFAKYTLTFVFGEDENGGINWANAGVIWGKIKEGFINLWDKIKGFAKNYLILKFGADEKGGISWPDANVLWVKIKKAFQTLWDGIKENAKSILKFVFGEDEDGGIKWPSGYAIWNKAKEGLKTLWSAVQSMAKYILKFVFGEDEDGGIKWPSASTVWNKIKEGLKTLWDGIKNFAKFTLKLVFGETEDGGIRFPSPATIWRKISSAWDTFWDGGDGKGGVRKYLENGAKWVLQLFGLPEETSEQIAEFFGNWWSTVKEGIQATATWVLGLFGFADKDEAKEHFRKWWEGEDGNGGVKAMITQVADWVLGALGLPKVEDIVNQISTWWNGNGEDDSGVKGLVMAAMDALLFTIGLPSAEKIKQDIINWWNGIVKSIHLGISAFFDGIFGSPQENTNTSEPSSRPDWYRTPRKVNVGTTTNPDDALNDLLNDGWFWGSRAQGLNYVPYDGYALVHRGETILNQDKSRAYRENNGFNVQELYNAVASAVEAAVANIQINMDGKQVGNAVTDQVSRNIYRAQYGRRFTFA